MNFGYISNGKLYVSTSGRAVEIKSDFAQQVIRRHNESRERNSWKSASAENGMMPNVWNRGPEREENTQVKILSAAHVPDRNKIYYTLRTEAVGGLFLYDIAEKSERRIFHKQDLEIHDLSLEANGGRLLCSVNDGDGTSIALLGTERYDLKQLTEGDACDLAPAWVPGENAIVFQSSGIGRNQRGDYMGLGNATIEKVSLSDGEQETLLSDTQYDYLNPKFDADGNLYCIRRPYNVNGRPVSFREGLKDIILMPYRLMKALFGFLDFMTRIFAKEHLINAATGAKKEIDSKEAFIKGAVLNLEKIDHKDENVSLIPSTWELIKLQPDGTVSVVKQKVLDFGLSADGDVITTNGFLINRHELDDGQSTRLHKGKEVINAVFAIS